VLEDHLGRPGGGLFVVYGRRRVGKTALLRRLLEGVPRGAYHVGTQSTITEELGRLSRELDRAWELPLLNAQPLRSTEALLALLAGRHRPSVLVLDEFPYLVRSDPSLPGQLQAAWDRSLKDLPLKLIVCGSSIGMMEELFLSRRAPLFGRRTGQLRVRPLAPEWVGAMVPRPPAEVVELAAMFGGIPGYLRRLSPDDSPLEALRRHVLSPGEPLYEEAAFLVREELREPRVYQGVLAAIAGGARKFGEISSKVGLDKANLSKYLSSLAELGFVEREVPVTEPRPGKSRKGRYRISDPFVATWYAWVHPHRDRLERGYIDEVVRLHVRPGLGRWLGEKVEPVLAQLLAEKLELDWEVAHLGRHWSPEGELDVVLIDGTRRRAFVAEVKWRRGTANRALMDGLKDRARAVPALAGAELTFGLVSRGGFSGRRRRRDDERFVSIEELVPSAEG